MKLAAHLFVFALIIFSSASNASIESEKIPVNNAYESKKSVDELQTRAIGLINEVGTFSNNRFADEAEKEKAQYAYSGFIARFEAIRSDREALERKEIMADNKTLEDYSKRLEQLTTDILKFLN